MYSTLLGVHSYLRYAVLILLLVVIITAFFGWRGKRNYSVMDNKLSLYLFIATHLQLLIGLILYTQSGWVQFGKMTMKMKEIRYWTVEHATMMLIAIVLITMARITAKKMNSSESRHKRQFIFNSIALLVILAGIAMSGRGII
jgi:hypothetical protein